MNLILNTYATIWSRASVIAHNTTKYISDRPYGQIRLYSIVLERTSQIPGICIAPQTLVILMVTDNYYSRKHDTDLFLVVLQGCVTPCLHLDIYNKALRGHGTMKFSRTTGPLGTRGFRVLLEKARGAGVVHQ